VLGANPADLEAKIKQHYVAPQSSGGTESGASTSQSAATVSGYPDITSNVDVKNVAQSPVITENRLNV